jgi:hypothetical protein
MPARVCVAGQLNSCHRERFAVMIMTDSPSFFLEHVTEVCLMIRGHHARGSYQVWSCNILKHRYFKYEKNIHHCHNGYTPEGNSCSLAHCVLLPSLRHVENLITRLEIARQPIFAAVTPAMSIGAQNLCHICVRILLKE